MADINIQMKQRNGSDYTALVGAINENVNRLNQYDELGIINIKVLGAKGNANFYNLSNKLWYEDSTFSILAQDDSSYILEAIRLCQNGGTIKCPTGNYLCSVNASWDGTISGFPSNTTAGFKPRSFIFEGDGSKTVFVAKPNSGYALKFANGSSFSIFPETMRTFERIVFKNFNVNGNKEAYGLMIKACSNFIVDNVQSFDTKSPDGVDYNSAGLSIESCGMFRVNNYMFNGTDLDRLTTGIKVITNSSDSVIENCDICFGSTGILIQETGEVKIMKNVIYANSKACIRTRAIVTNTSKLHIFQNQFEPHIGGKAISFTDTDDRVYPWSTVYSTIVGNTFLVSSDLKRDMIHGKFFYTIIDGNTFNPITGNGIGTGSIGIYQEDGGYNSITNNKFIRINSTGIGIKIDAGSKTIVTGNNVYDMDNVSTTTFIKVTGGTGLIVENNFDFSGSTSANFIDVNTIIPNSHFRGNIGSGAINITHDSLTTITNIAYNQLRLGDFYIWADTTGRLRIKYGIPSSDTDGNIVGAQTV